MDRHLLLGQKPLDIWSGNLEQISAINIENTKREVSCFGKSLFVVYEDFSQTCAFQRFVPVAVFYCSI